MKPRRTPAILILATVVVTGCSPQSLEPNDDLAPQTATPEPMPKTAAITPIDGVPELKEDSLSAVEQKYSCRLPDDYRKFMLQHNGGFPSPDCVTFTEDGRKTASDVFCFFVVGDKRAWASLEWHSETYSGRLPRTTLPIARDSCGNLWLLGIGRENSGTVYFWEHGSYDSFDETDLSNWPRVAASFQEFRDRLGPNGTLSDESVAPSRYALVKQAENGMAEKSPGFSTRANPGFVWHCDCDEGGNVTMQFVQYEVHAIATHTDGYSDLRARKGLIKEGPPRLPE